jgi:zinc and cadmium transporter
MSTLLLYAFLSGTLSLIGGLLLLAKPKFTKRLLTPLIAFAAGAFLAAAFLDIIPHALEHAHDQPETIMTTVLIGFITFFIIERFIMAVVKTKHRHGHHDHTAHSEHTEPLPFLLIVGDSFHNFLDGIVLAMAYVLEPSLALPTALAIAAHEIPQEIGDFAILLKLNWKRSHIILINIAQSLLAIPGAIIGYYLSHSLEAYLPYLLAGTGGVFLYIAASSLIPEIHHQSGHQRFASVILPLIIAVIIVGILGNQAHQVLPQH